MATIKQRKSTFSVIYWYLDNTGKRKQNGTRWKQEKRQNSEKPL